MIRDQESVLEGFWPALIRGSTEPAAWFAERPRIDHPPASRVEGPDALVGYLRATHHWLAEQRARWEPLAVTTSPHRVVHEGVLHLWRDGETVDLPMAAVADIDDISAASPSGSSSRDSGSRRVSALRIYHSMWPLEGEHTVRPPLLAPPAQHDALQLTGAVRTYQDALAAGDLGEILSAFGPHGCAREPSGGRYAYCGREKLAEFYGSLFSNGGGIALEHCTVTDDGVRCAIEYNAVRWGRTVLSPQAGVAVYERGPDGLLAAARIYDDVDPPPSAQAI